MNAKSEFVFDVDFDDLTQTELGALSFCIATQRVVPPKLGMGQINWLGAQQCIDIEGIDLVDREARYREQSACRAASTKGHPKAQRAERQFALAARYRESAACNNKVAAHALEVLGDLARSCPGVYTAIDRHRLKLATPTSGSSKTAEKQRYERRGSAVL